MSGLVYLAYYLVWYYLVLLGLLVALSGLVLHSLFGVQSGLLQDLVHVGVLPDLVYSLGFMAALLVCRTLERESVRTL